MSTATIVKVYTDALQYSDLNNDCPVDNRGYVDDWAVVQINQDIPSSHAPAKLATSILPVGSSVYQVGWLNDAMVWNQVKTVAKEPNSCPSPHPPAGQSCYGSVAAAGFDTGGDSGGPLYTQISTGLEVHGDLLVGIYTSTATYFNKIISATGLAPMANSNLSGTMGVPYTSPNYQDCAARCRIDKSCAGFTYRSPIGICQFYTAVTGMGVEPGTVAARREETGTCNGNGNGICPMAWCRNGPGSATDAPCGGVCGACSNGLSCLVNSDCISGSCQNGVCVGGPAPSFPPAVFYTKDSDRRGCTNCDWDPGYWKGTCASSEAAVGLSKPIDNTFTHALLCKNVGSKATGTEKQVIKFNDSDSRLGRRISTNWENTSSFRLECPLNQYVSGVSQDPHTFPPFTPFHGVRCAAGLGSAENCEKRLIQRDSGYSGQHGDWDPSFAKADCPGGKIMVGVSVDKTRKRPNSILCCSQGTTTRWEAESGMPTKFQVKSDDPDNASNGVYLRASTGAVLTWVNLSLGKAVTTNLEFGIRSATGNTAKMGVWVNSKKVGVITTSSQNWEIVRISASLTPGSNTIEIRDSEGSTGKPDVDYVQIYSAP